MHDISVKDKWQQGYLVAKTGIGAELGLRQDTVFPLSEEVSVHFGYAVATAQRSALSTGSAREVKAVMDVQIFAILYMAQ